MMRKISSRDARRLMQQMGVKFDEIPDAQKVVIKTVSKEIIINNPSVTVMNAKGEKMFQIMGEVTEKTSETKPIIPEEDVQLVAQQAKVSLEEARKALEQANGDLAQAILLLSQPK